MNGCQGDGFSSVGAQTCAIKLAMAGIQDWWCRSSIVGLLIYIVRTESLITKRWL